MFGLQTNNEKGNLIELLECASGLLLSSNSTTSLHCVCNWNYSSNSGMDINSTRREWNRLKAFLKSKYRIFSCIEIKTIDCITMIVNKFNSIKQIKWDENTARSNQLIQHRSDKSNRLIILHATRTFYSLSLSLLFSLRRSLEAQNKFVPMPDRFQSFILRNKCNSK